MAKMSISVVKGRGSMNHNNREFSTRNVDQDRTPDNIIYKQEPIEDAYQKLFQEEIDRYNVGKKPCRQIPNYMEHISNSKNGEKLFYETVVQVGNKFDCPVGSDMGNKVKEVLDDYMKEFQDRNPNLYVFNAVMHLDESTPHLHIDYIPVAHGYEKGLQVRNSLDKALKEQGIDGKANKKENSTHNWQEGEKDHLEGIMMEYRLERSPEKGLNRKHLTVEQYKAVAEHIHQQVKNIPKQIETAPTMLNKERVSVEKADLENLEQRAKLSLVHEKAVKSLERDAKRLIKATSESYEEAQEKAESIIQYAEEKSDKALIFAKEVEAAALSKHKEAEKILQEVKNYRNYNIVLVEKSEEILKENCELKLQNSSLEEKIIALGTEKQHLEFQHQNYTDRLVGELNSARETISDLQNHLNGMCESLSNVVNAVNMLRDDEKDEYKVAKMTAQQLRLFKAIENYAMKLVEFSPYHGFSKGIRNELKALEPTREITKGLRDRG